LHLHYKYSTILLNRDKRLNGHKKSVNVSTTFTLHRKDTIFFA
jgi:hypothetical protein